VLLLFDAPKIRRLCAQLFGSLYCADTDLWDGIDALLVRSCVHELVYYNMRNNQQRMPPDTTTLMEKNMRNEQQRMPPDTTTLMEQCSQQSLPPLALSCSLPSRATYNGRELAQSSTRLPLINGAHQADLMHASASSAQHLRGWMRRHAPHHLHESRRPELPNKPPCELEHGHLRNAGDCEGQPHQRAVGAQILEEDKQEALDGACRPGCSAQDRWVVDTQQVRARLQGTFACACAATGSLCVCVRSSLECCAGSVSSMIVEVLSLAQCGAERVPPTRRQSKTHACTREQCLTQDCDK